MEAGDANVDPLYEVDAPKFYDFGNANLNSSVGDSWFDQRAYEILVGKVSDSPVADTTDADSRVSLGTFLESSSTTYHTPAEGATPSVEPDSTSGADRSPPQPPAESPADCTAAPPAAANVVELAAEAVVGADAVTDGPAFGTRGQLRTRQQTAAPSKPAAVVAVRVRRACRSCQQPPLQQGAKPLRVRTARPVAVAKQPLLRPTAATAARALKPPAPTDDCERKATEATDGEKQKKERRISKATIVKPFSFETEVRARRRSQSVPPPIGDESQSAVPAKTFTTQLRSYDAAGKGGQPKMKGTIVQPFHFHGSRSRVAVEQSSGKTVDGGHPLKADRSRPRERPAVKQDVPHRSQVPSRPTSSSVPDDLHRVGQRGRSVDTHPPRRSPSVGAPRQQRRAKNAADAHPDIRVGPTVGVNRPVRKPLTTPKQHVKDDKPPRKPTAPLLKFPKRQSACVPTTNASVVPAVDEATCDAARPAQTDEPLAKEVAAAEVVSEGAVVDKENLTPPPVAVAHDQGAALATDDDEI